MTAHEDPIDTALREVTPTFGPWPPAETLRSRAHRRRTRRRATAGVGALAVGVAALLVVTTVIPGGPTAGPTRPVAANGPGYRVRVVSRTLPGGGTQLVADVTGRALPAGTAALASATAAAEERFGLALTDRLAAGGTGNVVDSPLSAAVVLAELELGARGATRTGIATALQSPALTAAGQAGGWGRLLASLAHPPSGVTLHVATSAWLQQGISFTPGYLAALAQSFGDDAYQTDFRTSQATAAINAWVATQTAGRIKTLFAPGSLDPSTILVLANALHFDAPWSPSLEMSATPSETFTGASGRPTTVPAVSTEAVAPVRHGTPPVSARVTASYTAVELPYAGGQEEAELIEPASLDSFLAGLTATGLDRITTSLRPTDSAVTMPTLSLTDSHPLAKVLSSMGMAQAFGDADLQGISPRAGSVSQVQQATRLVVDVHGTDAAAATGVAVSPSSAVADRRPITIDHPYLLLLRDRQSGLVLMSAVIRDPAGG
jgi:serine protease inhibitor